MKKTALFILFLYLFQQLIVAENGYRLWLRYEPVNNPKILEEYVKNISSWVVHGDSPALDAARRELRAGLEGMIGKISENSGSEISDRMLITGTPATSSAIRSLKLDDLNSAGKEGFIIRSLILNNKRVTIIAANTEVGVLYGVFRFLRLIQHQQSIDNLNIFDSPKISLRILNHWDNLDRTVERGYAGFSLWDWHKLPHYISPVYTDYARANASIGINATVLTNVNANALILTPEYLVKVAALADVFRPYGIRVFLTARFSAPIEIGKFATADPLDPEVASWWEAKVKEIYSYIPDFGGFLVKANSEGQPGPQNYGRTHADGANMLADALEPFGGIVMWRAFVYDNNIPEDRAKQAYNEFMPLDGKFRDNVIIQVKNGPVDFQPREPFHPLFGSMKHIPVMPEFQITQEYLGFATHMVYLAPLFTECLNSDTWSRGQGSTVAKVASGSLYGTKLTGMAGVTNIGNEMNWTGHPFAQSNWYAFGRLAWDPGISSEQIAGEWIKMTFTNHFGAVETLKNMMESSREITVNYMTPLGLHHLMGKDHHFGPAPWVDYGRADWTSVYYHKADTAGIGFNRSSTGSKATEQYFPQVAGIYDDIATCPENLLLWFHHVSWDHRMKSGRTLWDEMCFKYSSAVDSVKWLQDEWQKAREFVDAERFIHVNDLLKVQYYEAKWWRDACIAYFSQFSRRPVPEGLAKPEHDLQYYMGLKFYFVPGI